MLSLCQKTSEKSIFREKYIKRQLLVDVISFTYPRKEHFEAKFHRSKNYFLCDDLNLSKFIQYQIQEDTNSEMNDVLLLKLITSIGIKLEEKRTQCTSYRS
jgi:hypothetical protein